MIEPYRPKNYKSTPIITEPTRKKRILVLMPTYKWVPTETFSSFYHMVWYLLSNYVLEMQFVENTLIGEARNELVNKAIEQHKKKPLDYILWCDSDHIFSPELFEQLKTAMDKFDKTIVSALYFTRRVDKVVPVAYIKTENRLYLPLQEIPEHTVLRVDNIGFGMCLMKPQVLLDIKNKWSHPFTEGNDERHIGEDMLFIEHAIELGHIPYVYTDAIIRHCGSSIGMEEYLIHKDKVSKV